MWIRSIQTKVLSATLNPLCKSNITSCWRICNCFLRLSQKVYFLKSSPSNQPEHGFSYEETFSWLEIYACELTIFWYFSTISLNAVLELLPSDGSKWSPEVTRTIPSNISSAANKDSPERLDLDIYALRIDCADALLWQICLLMFQKQWSLLVMTCWSPLVYTYFQDHQSKRIIFTLSHDLVTTSVV